jgi:transposase
MAKPLVDDELWAIIEPLLPTPNPRRFRYPGRKPVDNGRALTGILFVLKTGIGWEDLPQEMGCGSGMTCWRRLRDWQAAGVWQQLHEVLLARLQAAAQLDWSRAVVDSAPVRALKGGLTPAESHGQSQGREQTPRDYGSAGHSIGDDLDQRQHE